MSTTAIIMAAGKATRMKSKRPKPLHEICGKSMLAWILEACWDAGVNRAIIIVGFGKEEVISQFSHDKRIQFIEQTEQLGTGHAARTAEPLLKGHPGDIFILAGDTPMIRGEILRTLQRAHHDERANASMATVVLEDPTGYGRVVRGPSGEFLDIVEQLDCTPAQRDIREVFPSFYCVKSEDLLLALSKLTNNNAKGEYYLTDIFGILRKAGKKVIAVQAMTPEDVIAPNTRSQLAEADAAMQDRIQRTLRDEGVTIVSGINSYIEADVTIGADTVVQPFSFIGRESRIGANCLIGPYASLPRSSIVPEGTTIAGNVSPETTQLSPTGK